MGSRWRATAEGLRSRLPRDAAGRAVTGIVMTIVGTGGGGANRIGGISYTAVLGHQHPLDGQSIDFGDHGIEREEVPRPWRELLGEVGEPFSFDLDRPDQNAFNT
jgi:hypothetical protein